MRSLVNKVLFLVGYHLLRESAPVPERYRTRAPLSHLIFNLRIDGRALAPQSSLRSGGLLSVPRAPKELPVSALIRNAHGVAEWKLFLNDKA
jgi:hypothetical protein